MRKKHLNFDSLLDKVDEVWLKIKDHREASKVKIDLVDALRSALACMFFQDPSLLQFQKRLQEQEGKNNVETLFRVKLIPKTTQMRQIIDTVSSCELMPVFKKFYHLLQRQKILENYHSSTLKSYYFPIDGSRFFSSQELSCEQCLVKEHSNGSITYEHQVLQGGIMYPGIKQVIPFAPEQIVNTDGYDKQDCEYKAGMRMLDKIKSSFPKLKLTIGGDGLFSTQPFIEKIKEKKYHYLLVAKTGNHKYMYDYINAFDKLSCVEFKDEDGTIHKYEWENKVPLKDDPKSLNVNFLRCSITPRTRRVKDKIKRGKTFKCAWVTDFEITEANIKTLVAFGRCRWKNENEFFNVLKNHGYEMEHNYGHGSKNLSFNFFTITLLAFFMHQILQMTDEVYKQCLAKFGSKKTFWSYLRSYIRIIVFDSWDLLILFTLNPSSHKIRISFDTS